MPLYSAVCPKGHKTVIFSKIANRDDTRLCEECSEPLTRIIDAPSVRPEITPYQSPVTGEWIDSRAQRREDLLRNGCLEWDPEIKKDLARTREAAFESKLSEIDKTVDETTRALVSAGEIPPL